MLRYLSIRNIAVIEQAEIQFTKGLHVLTGETGAGKSIVIDAINAVLGERTSRDLIRSGCKQASVDAVFCDLPAAALRKLEQEGVALEADGELLMQRVLRADGKNVCKLNGMLVTAGLLREIGQLLLNIHGQHDSQALLDPASHYRYLDAVAGNEAQRASYQEAFCELRACKRAWDALQCDEQEKTRQIDYLNFVIDELSKAEIQPGEYQDLKEKRTLLQNREQIAAQLEAAIQCLTGDLEQPGAIGAVQQVAQNLTVVSAMLESLRETQTRAAAAGFELEGLRDTLRQVQQELAFDAQDLAQIEMRLDLLYRLMQKYGCDEQGLLETLSASRQQLQQYDDNEEKQRELAAALEQAEARVVAGAQALTASREQAGRALAAQVCENLSFLDMPYVKFVPQITPTSYSARGCDKVEFLISANAGEPPKPLAKIASGGELSRIMLAIKSVLSEKDAVQTLIFDEIDAGISGSAAKKVGVQLALAAKHKQVICVTHLAQIAAVANAHMYIEKKTAGGRTYTSVTCVTGDARVREIARIISGGKMTQSLYQTAKEMLEAGDKINREGLKHDTV